MSASEMTPQQEHAFCAAPENQTPQGSPVRRRAKLTAAVPVRLPEDVLDKVRARAAPERPRGAPAPTARHSHRRRLALAHFALAHSERIPHQPT
ncbi:MAG: hypothetical protein Q8P38_04570 [Candidatus Nanopelagicales bacterium]|nr:hypothetical protein [Candidatus Nanopelagicales bacterium]